MASFNGPKLTNPIRTDVPDTQEVLVALAKQDPTPISDIPVGAKRLYEVSSGKWQWQKYNGSSWAAVPFLQHNVDQLDGYHAAITPAANTVAVRNASGLLQDSITGNAATASSAATLSQTLPVNKGGTGATTSEMARANFGVPPTSHASPDTAYGLGSNINYGHVRGDGETTDVIAGEIVVKNVLFNNLISLTDSGALGKARYVPTNLSFNIDTDDFDLVLINTTAENSSGTYPPFLGFVYIRQYYYSRTSPTNIGNRMQVAFAYNANKMWRRYYLNDSWSAWVKVIDETDLATASTPGIVKPGTGMTVDTNGALNVDTASTSKAGIVQLNNTVTSTSTTQGATANAVKTAYDKAVAAESAIANALSVGALLPSFASSMSGYLLCNGSAVSRITYANLFALLGTAFGEGDGSTTFNLPDFRDKTLWGANGNLMAILAAGLPNATGSVTAMADRTRWVSFRSFSGAIQAAGSNNPAVSDEYYTHYIGGYNGFTVNLSKSNSIYGNSTTVQPPAIAVNIFIKY